jgi:DNA invertase Pin-like site-specific DNA recombinase
MPVSHPPTRIVPCRKRGYGRDELARIMDFLHARDELVVVKLDRLGRSSRDVLNLVRDLEARGAVVGFPSGCLDRTIKQVVCLCLW